MEKYCTNKEFEEIIIKLEEFMSFCSSKDENDIDICVDYFNEVFGHSNSLILPMVSFQDELKLYHLRLNIHQAENIETIVPFSYCPNEALQSVPLGRLNLRRQAIFYSSTSSETCVKEMKIQVEKERAIAYFSIWKTLKNQTFNGFIVFSPDVSKLSNKDKEFEQILMKKLSFIGSKDYLEKYLRTLGKIMLGESYIPSAILANYLFNNVSTSGGIKINCIIYPSVQENAITYDYAFSPDAVDTFLKPVRICMGFLYKEGDFKITNSLIGIPNENVVMWYKPNIIPYEKVKFTKCNFIYPTEVKGVNLNKEDIEDLILKFCNSNKEILSQKITFNNEYALSSLISLSVEESTQKQKYALKEKLKLILNEKEICISGITLEIEYKTSFCKIENKKLNDYVNSYFPYN